MCETLAFTKTELGFLGLVANSVAAGGAAVFAAVYAPWGLDREVGW